MIWATARQDVTPEIPSDLEKTKKTLAP